MTRPASYNRVWAEEAATDQMGGESTTADQGVIEQGWVGSATAEPPTARMQNYWQIRVDMGLQEIERQGFLSWRTDVAYQAGALVYYAGYLFQAISANTGITPQGSSDNGIWSFIQPGKWPTTVDNITGILPVNKGGTGASDAPTARANLGLLALAIKNTISNDDWSGTDLAIINGGTGASNAADARTNLGLGTAAVASMTTSTQDTTVGRVLKVGDWGVGTYAVSVTDVDALGGGGSGWFRCVSTATGLPVATPSMVQYVGYNATAGVMTVTTLNTPVRMFERRFSASAWEAWIEFQPVTPALTALAALTPAANAFPYWTSATAAANATLTAGMLAGLALTPAANQILRWTSASAAVMQSFTTGAQALAALTYAADQIGYTTSASAAAVTALTAYARTLLDDADAPTARATLGLGTAATYTAGNAAGQLAPQGWDFIADSGTANAYVGTYSPVISTLAEGMVLKLKAANANTGASTFNPNGLGALPIVSMAHTALAGGEMVAGGDVWLQYNSAIGSGSWVLIASSGGNTLAGRLLRVSIYAIISGSQQVSVNGGTYTTVGATVFTPLAQAKAARGRVCGGGGAGGGSPAAGAATVGFGTGGHGGAYAEGWITSLLSSYAVTIGLGGTAGAAGAAGGAGGTSSIGTVMTANGGPGGNPAGPTPLAILGNTATLPTSTGGNLVNRPGASGASGIVLSTSNGQAGTGGSSFYGANNAAPVGTSAGYPGTVIGQGGSGAFTGNSGAAQIGGAGQAGTVIIEEYA